MPHASCFGGKKQETRSKKHDNDVAIYHKSNLSSTKFFPDAVIPPVLYTKDEVAITIKPFQLVFGWDLHKPTYLFISPIKIKPAFLVGYHFNPLTLPSPLRGEGKG